MCLKARIDVLYGTQMHIIFSYLVNPARTHGVGVSKAITYPLTTQSPPANCEVYRHSGAATQQCATLALAELLLP